MTKVCVFIPCHIYYDNQTSLLDNCLDSLAHQTIIPDIYVSVSFENDDFKKPFINILRKYQKPITTFLFSDIKLFQMEHIYKLTQKYANNYDLIMFCDDDDKYKANRVEKFVEAFKIPLDDKCLEIGGIREIVASKNPKLEIPEYWAYGISPKILVEFFDRLEKHHMFVLMKHKFGDMYLRHYLRKINKNKPFGYMGIEIPDKKEALYKYNTNNPNSICGSLKTKSYAEIEEGRLLIRILDCQDDSSFKEAIKNLNFQNKKFSTIIYNFCKILFL